MAAIRRGDEGERGGVAGLEVGCGCVGVLEMESVRVAVDEFQKQRFRRLARGPTRHRVRARQPAAALLDHLRPPIPAPLMAAPANPMTFA